MPVLVLTSDVSNESSLPSPRSITILKFRSCVKYDAVAWPSKQRRDDSNFLDKSGSQIPAAGLFQPIRVPRDLLTDPELTTVPGLMSPEIYRDKKTGKILFHSK